LKQKLEVVGVFMKFKARVKIESGCIIHTLRFNNGKEYTSETLDCFCEEGEIEHQLTTPYTSKMESMRGKIDL